ncbi:uncharacterized protein [Temnothorax nylanderi]|uniref:uncharacterized protein n=1 Tax=Temnothorax nylanderi TaxID=102681 RepID=UPI003A89675E
MDESVNESIGPVDRIKKKNCNVNKDLERDKVVSEYEKSDDRNSSYTVNRQTQDTHQIRKSYVNPHRKSPIKTNGSYTNSIKSYVPSSSKSHESQISDVMDMRYSPIDESVNESIGPVDRIKKKNCNVNKDLERDKVVSEYEKSDDRNSSYTANRQTQDTHQIRKSYVNPHRKSPIKTNGSYTNSIKSSGFNERTIMAGISDLRKRIDNLHVTLVKIYTATCHPEETFKNFDFGIPTLPFTSVEEFYKWEDCHLDEEKKLIMIRLLVEHGRENLKGSVYCIMRKLMTNKVAVNFNLKGTNKEGAKIQKKKFQNTMFYGLVIAALKRHAQERINRDFPLLYNREMSDSHIANWLKDAKKRLENDELRLKKSQQQDEQLENNENN